MMSHIRCQFLHVCHGLPNHHITKFEGDLLEFDQKEGVNHVVKSQDGAFWSFIEFKKVDNNKMQSNCINRLYNNLFIHMKDKRAPRPTVHP